jgi:DNA-binding response OmpR family regulator
MKKVLVIDDDTDLLIVLNRSLLKMGYTVKTIFSGVNVTPHVEEYKPDIIILDVFLKDADGREVCKNLKLTDPYKGIPIIMISAHTTEDEIFRSCPADDFIHKPFSITRLVSAISRMTAA